jgi:hypothetical protein
MSIVRYSLDELVFAMNPIDWLCTKEIGFNDLSREEHDAILHFALLWSLFEAEVLDTRACAKSIVKVSKHWRSAGLLKAALFNTPLIYFQNRYFQNAAFTHHYVDLHLRSNDNPQMVEAVLKGESDDLGDIAAALLIIVYRLRNNLFHGLKWAYGIQGQLGNFTNANALLMIAIELDRQS